MRAFVYRGHDRGGAGGEAVPDLHLAPRLECVDEAVSVLHEQGRLVLLRECLIGKPVAAVVVALLDAA